MSRKDLPLTIGATWFIDQIAVDRFGAPLDLTGGSVEFRLASASGLLVSLAAPADVDIAPGTGGGYTIRLAASDSRQASLLSLRFPMLADYEIDAITETGVVAVQNTGKVLLQRSLRAAFPSTPPSSSSSGLLLAGGGSLLLADGASRVLLAGSQSSSTSHLNLASGGNTLLTDGASNLLLAS